MSEMGSRFRSPFSERSVKSGLGRGLWTTVEILKPGNMCKVSAKPPCFQGHPPSLLTSTFWLPWSTGLCCVFFCLKPSLWEPPVRLSSTPDRLALVDMICWLVIKGKRTLKYWIAMSFWSLYWPSGLISIITYIYNTAKSRESEHKTTFCFELNTFQ